MSHVTVNAFRLSFGVIAVSSFPETLQITGLLTGVTRRTTVVSVGLFSFPGLLS